MNITTRVLSSENDFLQAKHLVHEIFIKELKRNFPSNNPSGVRVSKKNGLNLLEDDFDEWATWIGAFHNDKLVGCNRHFTPLNGQFEIERYHKLPNSVTDKKNVVESNRLVVDPEYRSLGIMDNIFKYALSYFENQGIQYSICTAKVPGIGTLYIRKVGYELVDNISFKYNPSDEEEVKVMILDLTKTKIKSLNKAVSS